MLAAAARPLSADVLAAAAVLDEDDPVALARLAGLRYVDGEEPGIRRRRCGRGFTYLGADGETVRDPGVRRRIEELVIPPAWTDVWICRSPKGHVQATGRDDKGRKQYRYHEQWRAVRDANKFAQMVPFAEALPRLRRRIRRDLALDGLPREKVLAALVRLLEQTRVRVGNEEYAKSNGSYGLTTLHDEHVEIARDELRFEFAGKGGKVQQVELRDARLAEIVEDCQEIEGSELFQYLDADGGRHSVDSGDVNRYLGDAMGEQFTAKDFRTWIGTVGAVEVLVEMGQAVDERSCEKNVVACIQRVAEALRNTPAVCREFYVHPAVLQAYEAGRLAELAESVRAAEPEGGERELRQAERVTLAVLRETC